MPRVLPTAACAFLMALNVSLGGVASKAVKEAADAVLRKFGKEAAEQGIETLTRKVESLAVKYGDDALVAVKKVGPKTFRFVEEAGEDGLQSVKLMARYGDEAVWVVQKQERLAIFVKYGDDAAEAMMKHGQNAEPLINSFGKPAAGALRAISPRNGRQLAIMANDGSLARIGRADELLEVVAKYGDQAMAFIWKNKGPLAIAATLTAFLANPQPFIDGTTDIAETVASNVVKPVVTEAAKDANWTLVLSILSIIFGSIVALKIWLRHRSMHRMIDKPTPRPSASLRE